MSEHAPRRVLPVWVTLIGIVCGVTAYFWAQGDTVVAGVLMLMSISALMGFRMGFARIGGTLAGFAVAYFLAPVAGFHMESHVGSAFDLSGSSRQILATSIAGIFIFTAVSVFVRGYAKSLMKDRPTLEACNEWLGAGLALVQAGGVILLLLGGAMVIEPMAKSRLYQPRQPKDALARATSKRVLALVKKTKSSAIGPWVERHNPFERVESLKRVKKSVQFAESDDPFSNSSRDNSWAASPEVRQALEMIKKNGGPGSW